MHRAEADWPRQPAPDGQARAAPPSAWAIERSTARTFANRAASRLEYVPMPLPTSTAIPAVTQLRPTLESASITTAVRSGESACASRSRAHRSKPRPRCAIRASSRGDRVRPHARSRCASGDPDLPHRMTDDLRSLPEAGAEWPFSFPGEFQNRSTPHQLVTGSDWASVRIGVPEAATAAMRACRPPTDCRSTAGRWCRRTASRTARRTAAARRCRSLRP